MDECFGPMKGDRVLVVSLDKVIDGLAPLAEEVKGRTARIGRPSTETASI